MSRLMPFLLCAGCLCLPCLSFAGGEAPEKEDAARHRTNLRSVPQVGPVLPEDKQQVTIDKARIAEVPDAKPSKEAKDENKPKSPKAKAAGAGGAAQTIVGQSGGGSSKQAVPEKVDPKQTKERLLLLAPRGPIVLEASITLDGQPFRMARERLVEELLRQADTDSDGQPTWSEAVGNPRFGFGRFVYYTRTQAQRSSTVKRYDTNQDGEVDAAEARSLIAQIGGGPAFRVRAVSSGYSQPDVKTILDEDKDGTISEKELAAAAEKLKSRDANDNDLLELTEAGGGVASRYRSLQVRTLSSGNRPPMSAYLLGPTADLVTIFDALTNKYATDSIAAAAKHEDGKIKSECFPLFPKLVNELDLNQNGVLDSGEVVGLHLLQPHVVLEVNLGQSDKRTPGIRLVSVADELGGSDRLGEEFTGQTELELPGLKLTFAARPTTRTYANYAQTAQSLLTRYDTDKNGYIEEEEFKKAAGQQNAFTDRQFAVWDANADGKVFAKEIEEAYRQQLAPQMTAVSASAATQGPSFFAALDETGDNRLSLREMKNAADRLTEFDKDEDGRISIEEMPVEMTVAFGRGYYSFYSSRGGQATIAGNLRGGTGGSGSQQNRGPEWFVRMDKNGDGDLTPREFLGSAEKFKEIDINGDGFIERKEAEAVDKSSKK